MEGYSEVKVQAFDVEEFLGDLRAKNEQRYSVETLLGEERSCMSQLAQIRESFELSVDTPRVGIEVKNIESSLYWAARCREEGDIGRAAENLSCARVQIERVLVMLEMDSHD